jgi:hypothetical protein
MNPSEFWGRKRRTDRARGAQGRLRGQRAKQARCFLGFVNVTGTSPLPRAVEELQMPVNTSEQGTISWNS